MNNSFAQMPVVGALFVLVVLHLPAVCQSAVGENHPVEDHEWILTSASTMGNLPAGWEFNSLDGTSITVSTTSNDICIKSFTVGNFAYTGHSLTNSQKNLVANIARDIGGGSLDPLRLVKEVRIIGYSSGTRNLETHANKRAASVFEELTKQLLGLGAIAEDINEKIGFGDLVMKSVMSQAASDSDFRKVVVCVVNLPPPKVEPPPPKKRDPTAWLREVKKQSSDETLQCMVNKMLDKMMLNPPGMVVYYTPRSIMQYIGMPLAQADITLAWYDLVEDFEKMLERRQKVSGKEPSLANMQDWLEGKRKDIIRSVDTLKWVDPYLPQARAIRQEVHEDSMRSSSVYSCKEVKKLVDYVMSKVGPPFYNRVWTELDFP